MIDFDTSQNLPKNVGDLGKLNVAKGIQKLPKVQKSAQSGHTGCLTLHGQPQSQQQLLLL